MTKMMSALHLTNMFSWFCSVNSLTQQSTDSHVASLGHIIFIQRQAVFATTKHENYHLTVLEKCSMILCLLPHSLHISEIPNVSVEDGFLACVYEVFYVYVSSIKLTWHGSLATGSIHQLSSSAPKVSLKQSIQKEM